MGATESFGQFLNLIDSKKDEVKVKGELARLAKEKERLLAELGRAVMSWEQNLPQDWPFADAMAAVKAVEAQESERQQELVRIQQASYSAQQLSTPVQASGVPMVSCPSCQTQVPLTAACCPSCGGDLSTVRKQYKQCPKCGAYYPAGNRFCMNDGGELEDIPNPEPVVLDLPAEPSDVSAPVEESSIVEDGIDEISVEDDVIEEEQTETRVCQVCGEPADEGNLFCGACGARLE